MSKKRVRLYRKLHKWPGILIAFLAILFVVSGIILNHRSLFSSVDVNRQLLPPGYQYENWNMAAVRAGLVDDDHQLIYGNIGVWKKRNDKFYDFNQGFPKGIDHRKIYSLARYRGCYVAATHFGLYARTDEGIGWSKIALPLKEDRLTDLFIKQDTLLVLSRSCLLKTVDLQNFDLVQLPAPVGYERKAGLFNTLWELHSGELFGLIGKLIVDLLGMVTIVLAVTGLFHFFFPKIARRRKSKGKDNSTFSIVRKKNLRWHNVVGYVFVLFLIINTTAGIFLRPPLLIPIVNKQVALIPGTHLDSNNPWFDKLRRGTWDNQKQQYIFSTSEGFFFATEKLNEPLQVFPVQPPVSVMGCNVFVRLNENQYLVGSFSGLFLWDMQHGVVLDAFTHRAPEASTGRPISDHMVAGYFSPSADQHFLFEYDRGMSSFENNTVWDMPQKVVQESPISLWNTALEIHTGRIFEHMTGPFYILYVPLSGICLIMVLISGFLIWWKAYRG